LLFLPELCSFR